MFGDTYPIVGMDSVRAGQRDEGLAEYVRLEFRPEDRAGVMFALRQAIRVERPRRRRARFVGRIRSLRAVPVSSGDR
jgi:hypothetical protein